MTIKQFLAIPLMLTAAGASSQVTSLFPPKEPRNIIYNYVPSDTTAVVVTEEGEEIDTAFFDDLVEETSFGPDTTEVFLPIVTTTLPTYTLRPAVFDTLRIQDSLRISTTPAIILIEDSPEIGAWLNEDAFRHDFMGRVRQNYFINHPDLVIYNEADLPEPPKHFTATVDPETARIVISEVIPEFKAKPELEVVFGKKHWLKEFNVNLQFSQAYVSPNWYQGGNN
ncbi:MAG: hypothetical protein K2L91_09240, partial [Duncaniella sp.]|nr:hypothetical protein [Duncaniella sp.]